MSHPVIVEVGGGCETLATSVASVRFLPSVDSSVSVQTGAGAESFVTEVTHVRSLPGVSSDVSL